MKFYIRLLTWLLCVIPCYGAFAIEEITQIETPLYTNGFEVPSVPIPVIINADENRQVQGDDYNAIVKWNSESWVNNDPELAQGIHGYIIEWGPEGAGFPNKQITPYRSHQLQPLTPGVTYQARVSSVSAYGEKSLPSQVITTQHDSTRVDLMRDRLDNFFDDFNLPAGGFNELKWNQAYSGCVAEGTGGQHINNQMHAHNLLSTGGCDRGVAVSRARNGADFNFNPNIGNIGEVASIQFDLDGAAGTRQFWYLDLIPLRANNQSVGRKRDITGLVSLGDSGVFAEPPGLLRIVQTGGTVSVQLASSEGELFDLHNPAGGNDLYLNGACGQDLRFCQNGQGAVNLFPQTNVRKQWLIELEPDHIKIYIENALVVDGAINQAGWVNGLPWDRAQINWTYFSYNTGKENIVRALLHWDNFGVYDGVRPSFRGIITHNYTDGKIGPENYTTNNCCAPRAYLDEPLNIEIPIPLILTDELQSTELMFTLQGEYEWSDGDYFMLNNVRYDLPEPDITATGVTQQTLMGSIIPFSYFIPIDNAHLIQGNNQIDFFIDDVAVFNVHLELTYPRLEAPTFLSPQEVFGKDDYLPRIMPNPGPIGPGISFESIGGVPSFLFEEQLDRSFAIDPILSGTVSYSITGNTVAQMTAFGVVTGITHYQIWLDGEPNETVRVNQNVPSSKFLHENLTLDTTQLCNGEHSMFVKAFSPDGTPSFADYFLSGSEMGEYRPVKFEVQNAGNEVCAP